ncbi:hypothetical protein Ddye_027190 [Dipteronia dyeriana]|uniref:DUF4283 domain-containing protein n=1 Tax=Dipteronia dyeriana TaxID=168575 RepID=A0AAD9TNM6_9ROSI|nr:hypothetical protein Ddye_027190 [Dipteronia dyeriana]
MNADEVADLCEAISLKDQEGNLVPLQVGLRVDGEKRPRLVGKILSNKLVNREAFIGVIPKIWRTLEEFEIEAIEGNIFSFTFKNAEDRHHVLGGVHGLLIRHFLF